MNHLSQEYIDYLQSPEWDKKRKQRLHLDGYTCQGCGAKNKPLDVHHLTYDRFGNEWLDDLESLCRQCHDKRHDDRPFIAFGICRTCGEFLAILVKRVKIWGTTWTDYTCQDGHMRSYRDE